jgi:MFS superfamily sulfate permease-like transporter
MIDASGLHALEECLAKCSKQGVRLILVGAPEAVKQRLQKVGFVARLGEGNMCATLAEAVKLSRSLAAV